MEIKYRNDKPYGEILFWDKSTEKQYRGKTFENNQNGTFFYGMILLHYQLNHI